MELKTKDDVLKNALTCPFCGHKPEIETSYLPTDISLFCANESCHVQPFVVESVSVIEQEGDTTTFSPQYEKHYESILKQWNTRSK